MTWKVNTTFDYRFRPNPVQGADNIHSPALTFRSETSKMWILLHNVTADASRVGIDKNGHSSILQIEGMYFVLQSHSKNKNIIKWSLIKILFCKPFIVFWECKLSNLNLHTFNLLSILVYAANRSFYSLLYIIWELNIDFILIFYHKRHSEATYKNINEKYFQYFRLVMLKFRVPVLIHPPLTFSARSLISYAASAGIERGLLLFQSEIIGRSQAKSDGGADRWRPRGAFDFGIVWISNSSEYGSLGAAVCLKSWQIVCWLFWDRLG